MANFSDHFSKQASLYSLARPTYPEALFEFIFNQVTCFDLAWDCATGNGQTALSLCEKFKHIIATDASENQLKHATSHEKIEYVQSVAEDAPFIKNESLDLITVSTALHWFNEEAFFNECKRVLKPNGLLAIWSYFGNTILHTEINELINHFAYETLKTYWPLGAKKNWFDQYKDVKPPFTLIESPHFQIKKELNQFQMIQYMESWSAVNEYKRINNSSPISLIKNELDTLWGAPEKTFQCTWDLVSFFSRK